MMNIKSLLVFCALLGLAACQQKQKADVQTPWGTTLHIDGDQDDTLSVDDTHYTLREIQQGGEMIMLTITGPATYYDYHGRGMGLHYLLCEKLAQQLGVTLRVDVCRDTLDMLQRLRRGEGDIIAVPLHQKALDGLLAVSLGTQPDAPAWVVAGSNHELAHAVRAWYKPAFLDQVRQQEQRLLSAPAVTRRVNPLMLSPERGTISPYDNLFRKYASTAGTDWVLLAAQCYQESCFDPNAHSWAGACGLMQIIPATADHLSLPRSQLFQPEPNISAAARYMRELQTQFSDVGNPQERLKFALAAYNGGYHHVRDAMALAKKYGHTPQRWSHVRLYILRLSMPQYYNDPVVAHGYMRGSETADYVDKIVQRCEQYRAALRTGRKPTSGVSMKHAVPPVSSDLLNSTPHRASKANKWRTTQ